MQEKIEGYRLSPQQEYMWSLQQDDLSLPDWAQCEVLIEGDLNPKILEAALQKVVERHEILRTTFKCLPGMTIPLQVIHDRPFSIGGAREQNLSVDLENGPLLQASLEMRSPQKYRLSIFLSPMCADAASMEILVDEISRCYAACVGGEELADEPIQYADVAEWLQDILQSEDTEIGKKYWIDRENYNITANLPFENQTAKEFRPEYQAVTVPDLTDRWGEDLEIFLLTCWQVLLWRLTGQQDIVVNTAFDGRKYEELEGAVGLFTKYLPLKGHLAAEAKFSEILQQVKESVREAHKWLEYFTGVEADRKSGFYFDFHKFSGKYPAEDLEFLIQKQSVCLERFKVKLACTVRDNALVAELHYDANLFSPEYIEYVSCQLQTLLARASENTAEAIAGLEILSDRQRHQLLVEFNQTYVSYPEEQCVHHLFESHVELYSDEIAAVCEDKQLTYRELNDRANQLAHYLRQMGVTQEDLVGIYATRSLETIVSILGILKAGAAYLPLDPKLPLKRVAFILQDARPKVLLTQQQLIEEDPGLIENEKIICLDSDWEKIALQSSANLNSKASNDSLIYVIYTSGSTGNPKGVAVEGRQLLNYVRSIREILNLPVGASFATVSTFGADLGNTVIFASLCGGGCLHVIAEERASDPEALGDYFTRHPIDCLKIVPAHLAALLTCDRPEGILPRQRIVLGGEASSWDLIAQIQHHAPACKIINHYGPTETTVGSLTYPLKQGETSAVAQTVPIGRPIANTQVYILDSYMEPVPLGVPGELYIGGAGVTRGYLHRQELTAEKFIVNPFSDGGIIYKTGDLARYLPDGNIEFLGRSDDMVKIRGFRIELPEISFVLSQHQAVRENVVVVREDEPGDKRLVAYIVPVSDFSETVGQPTSQDLRDFLQEQLPDYMIPGVFVPIAALPLTPNGKIDRRALPAPEAARSTGEYVAPRTPIEEILVDIWADILGTQRVGIEDNFFDLGGHSLLATRLVSRVRQTLRVEFSLYELFEEPTIASLSQILIKNEAKPGQTEKIAITLKKLQNMPAEAKENLLAQLKK